MTSTATAALIATRSPPAGYADQTAQPGNTYTYTVIARDAAGNSSAAERSGHGDDQQRDDVLRRLRERRHDPLDDLDGHDGAGPGRQRWHVRGRGGGRRGACLRVQAALPDLDVAVLLDTVLYPHAGLVELGVPLAVPEQLAKGAIAALFVSSGGKLGLRNDVTGVTTTSSAAVSRGSWHTVEMFGSINGTSGDISVWLDGSPVAQLTGIQSLGTTPIGYLQLGDSSATATSDVIYDDVRADPSMIQP